MAPALRSERQSLPLERRWDLEREVLQVMGRRGRRVIKLTGSGEVRLEVTCWVHWVIKFAAKVLFRVSSSRGRLCKPLLWVSSSISMQTFPLP